MKGTTRFLSHSSIKVQITKLLNTLYNENYLSNLDFEALVDRSSYYFAELNYIHPFREESGRATREFMRQLFAFNGYDIDWRAVTTEELLTAIEASVFDYRQLNNVLRVCLRKTETFE